MFPKHPINTYLFQSCTLPDIEIDQVAHGDVNRDVKTAGRVTIGNLIVEKLMTTAGSDTWLHDWLRPYSWWWLSTKPILGNGYCKRTCRRWSFGS